MLPSSHPLWVLGLLVTGDFRFAVQFAVITTALCLWAVAFMVVRRRRGFVAAIALVAFTVVVLNLSGRWVG